MKTALVTGADGGMGREICRSLLKDGYSLIIACLSTEAAMFFYFNWQTRSLPVKPFPSNCRTHPGAVSESLFPGCRFLRGTST
jgi:hypothetical protein